MITTCDDAYWQYMEAMKPAEAPCGQTFDDLDHSTICPHNPLPPKLSEQQLSELYDLVKDQPLRDLI